MFVAQLLAAFALLCGLLAVAIVAYAIWSDRDSRLRQAQAKLDAIIDGDAPLADHPAFGPAWDASLDAEIAEFERRERAAEGYPGFFEPLPAERVYTVSDEEFDVLSRTDVEGELGFSVDRSNLASQTFDAPRFPSCMCATCVRHGMDDLPF